MMVDPIKSCLEEDKVRKMRKRMDKKKKEEEKYGKEG
jgi:hypothetical protein